MPEMHELMQRAAQRPTTRAAVEVLWNRGRQRRRRLRALRVVVALGCVLAAATAAALITESDDRQTLDVIRDPMTPPAVANEREPVAPPPAAPSGSITSEPSDSRSTAPVVAAVEAVDVVHPVAEVVVVVMNGSGICGVATNYRPFIAANGYPTVPSENAPSLTPRSVVVFIEGYGADAATLGARLNMPVVSIPAPQRNAGWDAMLDRTGANVGVVLGEDALQYVAKPEVCGGIGELAGVPTTMRPSSPG